MGCIVHGVSKSRTDWAPFTFTFLSINRYSPSYKFETLVQKKIQTERKFLPQIWKASKKHCKRPVGPTVWLRLEEGLSPGRIRVEAAGAWGAPCCAAQKCPSLWSEKRKCAVSFGVLQGPWWHLIFLPALFLKECKWGGWGGPQGSEGTRAHSAKVDKLHHSVELAPSCGVRAGGLCATSTPLTPDEKETNHHR